MKIQLDQNGKTIANYADCSRAKGVLLFRKGKKMYVDVGNRVSAPALFATLSHLRSVTNDIYITSSKKTFSATIPQETRLSASKACFFLGQLLLQLVEHRHEISHTKNFSLLPQDQIASLPVALHGLCNLRLARMETALALSLLNEWDMESATFITPSEEMNYNDFGYRVRKLPKDSSWPSDETYLPLSFAQLLPSAYAPLYNCLAHIALCVRAPLVHSAQMKLTLLDNPVAPEAGEFEDPRILAKPVWHDVTRILFPFASAKEKPTNFRLLSCAIIDGTTKNIS